MSLISKFKHIQIEWIPREQNTAADRLSNYAYTKIIHHTMIIEIGLVKDHILK
jgi:ribonuclease HI